MNDLREFKETLKVNKVKDVCVGDINLNTSFNIFAGACAVESVDQIESIAKGVKEAGCKVLRGGSFKPRTSPYTFEGLGEEGLKLLVDAAKKNGLLTVSEITASKYLPLYKDIDILQVGARNMQNFELLKELGRQDKTILLKRGFSSTIEEFLLSAEYIMKEGNKNVILCERGIRTFEPTSRFSLDITSIAYLKEITHLPVFVDPSHAAGNRELIEKVSLAAVACGCDGLLIECHNDADNALCDGKQCIDTNELKNIVEKSGRLRKVIL